jgi:hypothetical protein
MALRPLPPAISPSPAQVCPPPSATIKGRGAPPGHHHTHLALNRVLPSPQLPLPERLLHRLFATVAQLCPTLRRPLLPPVRLTSVSSPFFLNRGEVPHTGTPFRPISGEPPRDGDRGPPWAGAAHGPQARGPGPRPLLLENNLLINISENFVKKPLRFFEINPRSSFCRFCT